jgi:hypothetical protein
MVRVELLPPDFRTATPAPQVRVVRASLYVADGALVIDTDDSALAAFIRSALAAAAGEGGGLQLPSSHTTEVVDGVVLNVHFPGDFVTVEDARYPEAVARALCFLGEHDPTRRYRGLVLDAFVEHR